MSQVEVIHPGGVVTRQQQDQLKAMESAILAEISRAKAYGVPQGLIVAVLHAHAAIQTNEMIRAGEEV